MGKADGSKRLKSKQRESFARGVALNGMGLSEAYRAFYDCSGMKTSSINSNAKKLAKETPVRLRIAWLKAHGMPEVDEKGGRPTDFRPEYCEQATALCRLGATDKEMAAFFGCAESTLYLWQKEHAEFSEAIRAGKLVADMEMANSMYKLGKGHDYYEDQAVKVKDVQYADGKKIAETERVEIVQVRKIVPPEMAAISMWLTNRQKDKWKHRVSNEHAGEGGGPMQVQVLEPKLPPKDACLAWGAKYLNGGGAKKIEHVSATAAGGGSK